MSAILDFANLLVSLASTVFGVVALVRPGWLIGPGPVGPGQLFYARMYAARAIPLGLSAGVLPFRCLGSTMAWLLFMAALVQMIDYTIGYAEKKRGMMIGPPIAALVHVLCGLSKL